MKLRVLVVCLVALGLSASVAIAAPPPGKGKPASPGNSAAAGKPPRPARRASRRSRWCSRAPLQAWSEQR